MNYTRLKLCKDTEIMLNYKIKGAYNPKNYMLLITKQEILLPTFSIVKVRKFI